MVYDAYHRVPDPGCSLSVPCDHCGLIVTQRCNDDGTVGMDPDPCLGVLPGVWVACCGHGDPSAAYYSPEAAHRERIGGREAVRFFSHARSAT